MRVLNTMRSVTAWGLALVLFAGGAASAGEWNLVGSRYQAMGGAGVAVVDKEPRVEVVDGVGVLEDVRLIGIGVNDVDDGHHFADHA